MSDAMFLDAMPGLELFTVRGRLSVGPAPRALRVNLRGSGEAIAAAGGAFGFALPDRINTAASDGEKAAFKLGPDEWLLIAPALDVVAFRVAIAAATSEPHSIVEISNRNTGFLVSGSVAEDVLNAMNPLDLSLGAFSVGMATRTIFGKAEVVLWRKEASTFHLECWRSFAPYVHGHLCEAARDHRKG